MVVNIVFKYICKPRWELGLPKVYLNNVAESVNHKMKSYFNWKKLSPSRVVSELHELVQIQFIDIRKAFVGKGNYLIECASMGNIMNDDNFLNSLYESFLRGSLELPPSSRRVKHRQKSDLKRNSCVFIDNLAFYLSTDGTCSSC